MRYLGIDFGTKRVGLALSDEGGTMGFPHATVPNDSRLMDVLVELVSKEQVQGIVMGESLNLRGGENPVAAQARSFGETLAGRTNAALFFEPELFTTQEARRDAVGVRTHTGTVDASAAALILSGFLAHHNPRPDPGPNSDL